MNTLYSRFKSSKSMSKPLISITTVALIITSSFGCTAQDKDIDNTSIMSKNYEPCCSSVAEVSKVIEPGINIFVPNVFTPNKDGINDLFYPSIDTTLISNGSVSNFTIFDSDNNKNKRIVFHRDWINYNDIKNYGFTGEYFKNNNKTEIWEGQFWYSFSIIIDGKGQFNFKGSACSVVCDEESAVFKSKKDCFFPSQVTKDNKGDNKIDNKEKDCFK